MTARIWDAVTGREVALLAGHTKSLSSAAFSPDGRRVMTASQEDMTLRIWDVDTGRQVALLEATRALSTQPSSLPTASAW